MRVQILLIFLFVFMSAYSYGQFKQEIVPDFTIILPKNVTQEVQQGRLLLVLSTNPSAEPRFQTSYSNLNTQLIFGLNVENWKPGGARVMNSNSFGWPVEQFKNVPNGDYYAQVVLNRYDTYYLGDGRVLDLPTNMQAGQQWNRKPGNFYSEPKKITIGPESNSFTLELSQVMPPKEKFVDTKYVKHVEIRSELLSEFWGRDVTLGALILLPKGFNEHPNTRYPLMINHGHYPSSFDILETPPEKPATDADVIEQRRYTREQQAYEFFKIWTGTDIPRYLIVKIQHTTPYYDDSYAVNSENNGPYGDAITYELIPYIEKQFRGIGKPWARYLYGGSTGGWEALAAQIFYPDEYGGTFSACPDPIDFRGFQIVNIYEDNNAYFADSEFRKVAKPYMRDSLGNIYTTMEEETLYELARGTKSRGGEQLDGWNATYSPAGIDGYPADIWDRKTGKINREVASYWLENYDLRYILERDWNKGLGQKLKGKIHIYTGEMDTYYLNLAVYHMETFLEQTKDPYYAGKVDYGVRRPHCYSGPPGGPGNTNNMHLKYLPRIMELIKSQAPESADFKSWIY